MVDFFLNIVKSSAVKKKIGLWDLVFEWKIKTWSRNDREKRKNTAILGLTFGMLINKDYIYYEKKYLKVSTNVEFSQKFNSENRIELSLTVFEWRIHNRNEVHWKTWLFCTFWPFSVLLFDCKLYGEPWIWIINLSCNKRMIKNIFTIM